MVKDPKTGKMVPEQIQNPLHQLMREEYSNPYIEKDKKMEQDFKKLQSEGLLPENASYQNFYVKKGKGGEFSFACLDEHGKLRQSGSYKRTRDGLVSTGIWQTYNQYAELEDDTIYDADGKEISSKKYEVSTGRVLEETYLVNVKQPGVFPNFIEEYCE